jgi:hypothetical protein
MGMLSSIMSLQTLFLALRAPTSFGLLSRRTFLHSRNMTTEKEFKQVEHLIFSVISLLITLTTLGSPRVSTE